MSTISTANFEVHKTTHTVGGITSLGGDISADLVNLNDVNNLFDVGSAADCINGSNKYRIFMVKFLGPGVIRAASLVMNQKPRSDWCGFKWAFDPLVKRIPPYAHFNGVSDDVSVPSTPELQLNRFTVMAWFRTPKNKDFVTDAAICNKGGFGSDTTGSNMSYGLYLNSLEELCVDFETSLGVNHTVTSSGSGVIFNDGQWHHGITRYGDTDLRLMWDFNFLAEKRLVTQDAPEVNTQYLHIGRNSRAADRWYEGDIGQVLVYRRRLLDDEIELYRDTGVYPLSGLVYANNFDNIKHISAQLLTDENHGPDGSPSWNLENPIIPNYANVGDMNPGDYFPVIGWWSSIAGAPDMDNLLANLNLYYRLEAGQIGAGPGENPVDPSPDPETPPVNTDQIIDANADWGCENMTEQVVKLSIDAGANLKAVLWMGDATYTNNLDCLVDIFDPIIDKVVDCIGNHDTSSSYRADMLTRFAAGKHYYQNIAKSYYYVIKGNVAIIVMDSEISFSKTSDQGKAIISFFDELDNNSSIDWRFVTIHRPFVGPDSDHPNNEGNKIQTWMPTFQARKVDAVYAGHNHNAYISYQLQYNADDPTNPSIISTTSPYTAGAGIFFFGNGTGGHDSGSSLYSQGAQPAFIAWQSDEDNGMLRATFTANGKTCTFSFYDVNKETLFSFVVNKA